MTGGSDGSTNQKEKIMGIQLSEAIDRGLATLANELKREFGLTL